MALRLFVVLALCCVFPVLAGPEGEAWRAKVDASLLDPDRSFVTEGFIVVLAEQANVVADARALRSKQAKGQLVFERLRAVAAGSQGALLADLNRLGVRHQAFWIYNMVWVEGDRGLLEALARRAEVARIHANPTVRMAQPLMADPTRQPSGTCPAAVSSGVTHTGAPTNFWAQGVTGEGVVVGGQDTGYDWDHVALKDQYRGWNGVAADHNYNWHDAVHSGGGACGANSNQPCDDNSHGTHTMGTMVGDNGTQIMGMAPGAKWIGCRNMDQGNGTPTTYAECFQFFLAPTDLTGANPDPAKAPDVINNSWGCPASEGCTDPNVLRTITENLRAAGVMVVASAGNSGSGCASVDTPAAIYDASFTVGATNNSDAIAGFSSRGAVTVDGSNRLKPDIVAPGVGVCSTTPNNNYSDGFSGTSMAGPHVAGLVALLISAQPCLRGDIDAIEQYIIDNAVALTSGQTCGGVPGSQVPNNTYGYGAIRAILPTAAVCGALFTDGFEAGNTSSWVTN